MKQTALSLLGWGFVIVGVVGIVLPLVPTTPFLLLALMCFSRSSTRFHDWLYHHPTLGVILREWRENRRIPPQAFIAIAGMVGVSLMVSVWWLVN